MKRRDLLKTLTASTFGAAVMPVESVVGAPPTTPATAYARTPAEAARDARLRAEKFLTPQELKTITLLCDIILPAEGGKPGAVAAGVPAFIEFIVKDMPHYQTPIRGGLMWLDAESRKRFNGKKFAQLIAAQRIEIIDDIAYPEQAKREHSQGVAFFNRMRDLTLTGFYTTRMGFDDLGYVGNTPNKWEGVPDDVLKQYGFATKEG